MLSQTDTPENIVNGLKFNSDGLIPAIAQDHKNGDILMMAWMNADAVAETLTTGRVCYYSRSRQKLWRKGETSGQQQQLIDFRTDCDRDTILVLVEQTGVACHTGRRSCFSWAARDNEIKVVEDVITDPAELYKK